MLVRCEFFISQMAKSSFKILSERYYPSLINLSSRSYNIDTTFKRFDVSTPDFKQVKWKEQMLSLDIDVFEKKDIKFMFEPMNYYLSMPKVNIRTHLLKGLNYWMNLPDDMIKFAEELSILYYESIVMLDDVYDQSEYRRGLPPAHKIFGTPLIHICGKASLFLIMKKLIELNNIKAIEIYANSYLKFCVSTYKEMYFRDNMICPTMHEYKKSLCHDKCLAIIGMPFKIMQLYSSCKLDFSRLLNLLCMHQIYQNDISNLCDKQCWNIKGFCDDISEGKLTLATIHAINSGTLEGDIVFSIYRRKPKDLPTLKYCLSLMEKLGSIDYAKKATEEVENQLREEIERLGGNQLFTEYVDAITSWGYDEAVSNNKNEYNFETGDVQGSHSDVGIPNEKFPNKAK